MTRETTLSQLNSLQTFSQIFSTDIFARAHPRTHNGIFYGFFFLFALAAHCARHARNVWQPRCDGGRARAREGETTQIFGVSKSLEIIFFNFCSMACERIHLHDIHDSQQKINFIQSFPMPGKALARICVRVCVCARARVQMK